MTLSRLYIRRGRLWWDDAFALFSMIFLLVQVTGLVLHVQDNSRISFTTAACFGILNFENSKSVTANSGRRLLYFSHKFLCYNMVCRFIFDSYQQPKSEPQFPMGSGPLVYLLYFPLFASIHGRNDENACYLLRSSFSSLSSFFSFNYSGYANRTQLGKN